MKLRIEIDLENDAFKGRARAVRECRRIMTAYFSRCAVEGMLVEKLLLDKNGNSVGKVDRVEEDASHA